jgi:outer membrane PBP1 activator LpoA protein
MRTRFLTIIGLAAALTLPAGSAAAQALPAGDQARARLRERISDLYLLRLTRALDFSEDQAAKLYPLLVRAEKEKAEFQHRMGLDLGDLRAELAKAVIEEERVVRLAGRIREARRAIREKDDQVEAALEAALTPVQRARYLIFTVDFLRSVGENLGRARGVRAPLKRSP